MDTHSKNESPPACWDGASGAYSLRLVLILRFEAFGCEFDICGETGLDKFGYTPGMHVRVATLHVGCAVHK